MDIKGFKRDCLNKTLELEGLFPSGYCYITLLDNREKQTRAGVVVEVSLMNAARHLCERSAELSSETEIQAYQARCAENRQQIVAAGKRHLDKELRISVNR
jgi:hypothetical protein